MSPIKRRGRASLRAFAAKIETNREHQRSHHRQPIMAEKMGRQGKNVTGHKIGKDKNEGQSA